MAAKATVCSRCGGKISNGLNYSHNGKVFCYSCFQEIQTELLSTESEQQELYQYIKQLFSVSEIPINIITFITKEVSNGKKYKGIKLTLYYYYEVMEHSRANIDNIVFVIRDQYENARKYRDSVNVIKKINEQVDLSNTQARTILIPVSELRENNPCRRKKKKYDIGDL